MKQTPPEKEIERIERELDAPNPPAGKPPVKSGGGDRHGKPHKGSSFDAVLVAAALLFVVAASLAFAGRLSTAQRQQLTAGSVGGAIGLLIGYGVGRIRP
ncbi:hypothetical protein KR52_05740 [Synechococcus sp. KORDI-52]|uniref:hypothetical protein n=1 Tax=Synechococcus sp. KORDI-52 TaxID=585425 RepID=UPI0004E0A4AA|nr:hypothetical protein [Synechococcus sp. KORDI-52]AII48643.1 hypothetical protein KR52_05740 [Synechococcus sp. KORDI-52]